MPCLRRILPVPQIRIRLFAVYVGNLLRLHLRATEDDGEDARMVVHDALQSQVFVLGVHQIVDMVHVLGALVSATHDTCT